MVHPGVSPGAGCTLQDFAVVGKPPVVGPASSSPRGRRRAHGLGRGKELQDLREEVVALQARVSDLTVERDDATEHWRRVEDFTRTRRYGLARPADVRRSVLGRR